MTLIKTINLNRITFHEGKQGVQSDDVGALAPEFKKSAADLKFKSKPKSLRSENTFNI